MGTSGALKRKYENLPEEFLATNGDIITDNSILENYIIFIKSQI